MAGHTSIATTRIFDDRRPSRRTPRRSRWSTEVDCDQSRCYFSFTFVRLPYRCRLGRPARTIAGGRVMSDPASEDRSEKKWLASAGLMAPAGDCIPARWRIFSRGAAVSGDCGVLR